VVIYVNSSGTNEYITVGNHFISPNAMVPTGVRVTCGYDVLSNMWKVNGADCFSVS
jgi:hypothetical protein